MLIEYIPTYKYFSSYIQIESTQSILDFGSNCGNFLKSSPKEYNSYTGVDVDPSAILEGKRLYPQHDWVWYNRYNPVYNPDGCKSYPVIDLDYDLIISYSVFSHIPWDDAVDLLEFLYNSLSRKGRIVFSYCNVDNIQCVEWFRNRRLDCDMVHSRDFVYLVDNKVLDYIPKKCDHFVTFYRTEWLLKLLSKFNPVSYNPPEGWVQDCMMLVK